MEKILVVDDELDILSQMKVFLSSEGYEVYTATNGMEAIRLFRKHHPKVNLIDYKMPGMDGLELLREIKLMDSRSEIILISGHADMKVAVRAIKEHAFDFLPKPVDFDELLKKIKMIIESYREKEEHRWEWTGGILLYKYLDDEELPIIEIIINDDLDEYGSARFVKEFEALESKGVLKTNVLLSLGKVKRINNIGLNTLISINDRMKFRGCKVALIHVNSTLYNYLHMLGYDNYFRIINASENISDVFKKD